MRPTTRILASTTLTAEAFVVFFAGLVAKDLSSLSTGAALGLSGALAVACLVTAGLLRTRAGYVLGTVLQVLVVATGLWVPVMFVLGAIFAVLWALALRLGGQAERRQAEFAAAADAAAGPAGGGTPGAGRP